MLISAAMLGACSSGKPAETQRPGDPHAPAEVSSAPATTGAAPQPTPEPEQDPVLRVTISGDDVGPNAETIEVPAGEPLTIWISSDRPGQLHVHSKPEQFVDFAEGASTHELVVETPGTVEIEEHDTSAVVAQVRVTG
jgi:hypothetical protein